MFGVNGSRRQQMGARNEDPQDKPLTLDISSQDFFFSNGDAAPSLHLGILAFSPSKALGQIEATGKHLLPETSLNPSF